MSERASRSRAEWVSFGVACAVLLVVVSLIGVQLLRDRSPAAPIAHVLGRERVVGDQHFVNVEVENRGDDTASNVQVSVELVVDGEATSGDQTVDFLAGHETEELVFVFADSTDAGDLTVAVTGFGVP